LGILTKKMFCFLGAELDAGAAATAAPGSVLTRDGDASDFDMFEVN
jgi:hypothetical protein